jgi:hypothetical protein
VSDGNWRACSLKPLAVSSRGADPRDFRIERCRRVVENFLSTRKGGKEGSRKRLSANTLEFLSSGDGVTRTAVGTIPCLGKRGRSFGGVTFFTYPRSSSFPQCRTGFVTSCQNSVAESGDRSWGILVPCHYRTPFDRRILNHQYPCTISLRGDQPLRGNPRFLRNLQQSSSPL